MVKNNLFFFLFVLSLNFIASNGDSLKLRSKHIISLSVGGAESPDLVGKKNGGDKYSYSKIKTYSINYGYCINSKTKKPYNVLYLGVGINYMNFKITRELIDVFNQSKTGYTKYTYDPNNKIINYNIQAITTSVQLEHHRYFWDLVIMQKFGICYSKFLNPNTTYTFSETFDTEYVASNSNGYYIAKIHEDRTITEKMNFFNNYFSPFYNISIGYKIKHFVPFVAGELFVFNGSKLIFNYQGGVKILF